jgi:hypothetical protein
MYESFTPDEELIVHFLKRHSRSTTSEIAVHTGLKHRGVLTRALEGLNAKGVLRHTDDKDESIMPFMQNTRMMAMIEPENNMEQKTTLHVCMATFISLHYHRFYTTSKGRLFAFMPLS